MTAVNLDKTTILARYYRSYGNNQNTVNYGGLSAGVIIAAIVIMFVIMWLILYSEEKKNLAKNGTPINHMKVIGMAALCAIGVGFVMMCLGYSSSSNNDRGGDPEGEPTQQSTEYHGAGLYAPEIRVPQMSYPNVYAGPVQSAAVDPIQG